MNSALQFVRDHSKKTVRLGTVGVLLLVSTTLFYLLSHGVIQNPSLIRQPNTGIKTFHMAEALSSSMRFSTVEKDYESIRNFSASVLGYEEFPDQCKTKPGFHQAKTLPKFDLMKYGPYKFLPNFRNPCWLEPLSNQLMCLPYFYLAGFPKSGTTDMYERITRHPNVAKAVKEPHWITRVRFQANTLDEYTTSWAGWLIRNTTSETLGATVVGDGSASTAWDNHKWETLPGNENCTEPRIIVADYTRHLNPSVKIIMMLRNPTTRLYSEYEYFGRDRKSPETFHILVKKRITAFNACLRERSLRSCAYDTRGSPVPRLYVGLYSVFLEDWLLRFPREQILTVRLEDEAGNVTGVLQTVFKFLELPAPSENTMHRIESMKKQNVLKSRRRRGPMWNETRVLLDNFYRPFNRRLADILRDTKFTWEDT